MLPTLLDNAFKYTKYYNDFNNSVYDCSGIDLCRNGNAICYSLDYELYYQDGYYRISVPQQDDKVLYLYSFYTSNCRHISDDVITDYDQYHVINLNGKLDIITDFEETSGYVQYLTNVWQIKVLGSIVELSCHVFKPV